MRSFYFFVVAVALFVVLVAYPQNSACGEELGTLLCSYNFDDGRIPDGWRRLRGEWSIEKGSLRDDGHRKYLYAVNWSEKHRECAMISIKGQYDKIRDLGLERPMLMPVELKDGKSYFKLSLKPGQATLLELILAKGRERTADGGK